MASHNKTATLINKRGRDVLDYMLKFHASLNVDFHHEILWLLTRSNEEDLIVGLVVDDQMNIHETFSGYTADELISTLTAFESGYKKGSQ